MAADRTHRGRSGRRPSGPKPGSLITGTIVGQAKRGVLVELGSTELLLPRSRYGAATDRIEASGYGDALTVEVVADPGHPSGVGLTRVALERSLRQPRLVEGRLSRDGAGFRLAPSDGSPAFAAMVIDQADPDAVAATTTHWLVGAPHRDLRFLLVADA